MASVDLSADLAEGCGLAAVAVWRCLRREAAGDTAGRDALTVCGVSFVGARTS